MTETRVDFRRLIQSVRDFPKPGVVYFDFTPILADPAAFRQAVGEVKRHFGHKQVTRIAAIEAKGFTLGSALAYEWGKPLILMRKPELTPGVVDSEKFEKEYGFGEYQLKAGQIGAGDSVLIIYDIMAGAGATRAAINLIERTGARVAGCAYVIELEYLGGRENLPDMDLFSLVKISSSHELLHEI